MKELKGALISIAVLALIGVLYFATQPAEEQVNPQASTDTVPEYLFRFEKQDLIKVEITRPNSEKIVLIENDTNWMIEGTSFAASKTMVNRLKHQLHDLTPRAVVRKDETDLELYGLGKNAIQVTLHFRDGNVTSFNAGDPNPTGVSYYIQTAEKVVYVVKKSALDYLSHDFDQFREPRFLSFFSTEVAAFEVDYLEKSRRWSFQREGENNWQLTSPQKLDADAEVVRTMLGRISALKATSFFDPDDRESEFGLQNPRLTVNLTLNDGRRILLRMGDSTNRKQATLSYFQVDGDETIYLCPDSLIDEFSGEVEALRNRKVVNLDWNDIETIDATIIRPEEQRPSGNSLVKLVAGQWVWSDGVPVPGSTPRRVAQAIAGISVIEFVDNKKTITDPFATIVVSTSKGEQREIVLGGFGESFTSPEGNEYKRRYMQLSKQQQVYLIDEHLARVLYDLIREQKRKESSDMEKEKMQKKIKEASEK